MKKNRNNGFTLLELLIVIAIIAILSVILVIVLNPSETLKKSRDAQRLADLSTLKTTIALYMTSKPLPILDNAANSLCKAGSTYKMWYSTPSSLAITDSIIDGGLATNVGQSSNPSLTNAQGWIPIDFTSITGGSPISNLPIDPINTVATLSDVSTSDFVYRYACQKSPLAFEIDAQLESNAYTIDENKRVSDGGSNINVYEVGTDLLIIGAGTDF